MKLLGTQFDARSRAAARAMLTTVSASPSDLRSKSPSVALAKEGRPDSQSQSSVIPSFLVPAMQARWLGAGISFYTPQNIEYILRQALAGDLQSQWEMFDLMETTWPELSKCLNQLRDGVVAMVDRDQIGAVRFEIKPFTAGHNEPTEEAERRRDLVEEALYSMRPDPTADENDLESTVADIMDARGKGISVLEIDWEMRDLSDGPAWAPRATRWVHPSWYGYPFGPGNERLFLKLGTSARLDNQFSGVGIPAPNAGPINPRLSLGGDRPPIQSPQNFYSRAQFTEFPPNKFLVAVCKNKTGHPLGGALLHVLAWYWAAMNFSLEWFLNFTQIFGQPFRWATYDQNLSSEDQAKLNILLQNMGSAAYASFPAGVTLELKEAAANAGNNPQLAIIQMANKAAELLILRQTLTADVGEGGGGSNALGQVHERILDDVKIGCGKFAAKTLQQLVRSILILNTGDDTECPTVRVLIPEADESETLSKVLVNVEQSGFEPTDEAIEGIGGRLGFPVQRKAALPNPVFPGLPSDLPPGKSPSVALAKEGVSASASRSDRSVPSVGSWQHTVQQRAPQLAAALRAHRAPIKKILDDSVSAQDFQTKLAAYYRDWDQTRIAREVEDTLQILAAQGAASAALDPSAPNAK